MLGDWDAVEAELAKADADGLADHPFVATLQAWLAALRGDADRAEAVMTAAPDMRASEEPQARAEVSVVEAFIAAARRQPEIALRHARATLAYADVLGVTHEATRWAWPLAARAAWELDDAATTEELLAMLDALQPGRLPPMLRAERDLAVARRSRDDGTGFAAAITGQRELSTPYHLAHGLLDYARELTRRGEDEAAADAADEATAIAVQLRCQPLLDRVAELKPGETRITAAAGARRRTRATDTQP
jgi:hypothetical protein